MTYLIPKKVYLNTISALLLVFIGVQLSAQSLTGSNLPIVVISTNGQAIEDDPKVTCDMGIIWNTDGSRNFTSDSFNDFSGKIGIEIRGSTSQQYPKKSYGFETRDAQGENLNVSLLGLPSENDWILYGAYPDKSLIRNSITYSLFSNMQPWSPRFVYCELIIDNDYLGIYALVEKIKVDDNRVDIATLKVDDNTGDELTGGYIIKVDKPIGNSGEPWESEYQEEVKFLYHDPKYEDLSQIQRDYIKDYVSDFEDILYGPNFKDPISGYRSMINVESFIDFMLMQELRRTVDGYRSSSFMYKDKVSKGGKLTCGPMWDFNLSYGNATYCDAPDTTGWQYNFAEVCDFNNEPPEWWPRLLEDTTFANELQCRWQSLRGTILSKNYIDNFIDSTALYLDEAQDRNFTKWPILGEYVNWNFFIGETYEEEIDYLKWWFDARSIYMDANLPGRCTVVSAAQDELAASGLRLFPNPTSGAFTVTTAGKNIDEVQLMDLSGRALRKWNAVNAGSLELELDGPAGVYLIRVTTVAGERSTLQVVKQEVR
ncbi:MAG: CotH kinase family protein [Saprospiraceae bacterium]